MNNDFYPNEREDLHDFLSHPQHWPGTELILQRSGTLAILHYSPLLDKFYFYQTPRGRHVPLLGSYELCEHLVQEGWRLEEAK